MHGLPYGEHIRLADASLTPFIYGAGDELLHKAERRFNTVIQARGNTLSVESEAEKNVAACVEFFRRLYDEVSSHRRYISESFFLSLADAAEKAVSDSEKNIRAEREHGITVHTPKKTVVAYSPAQKAYVEALRKNDLVFAAGPAGTGKTFLAVACAVEQFSAHRFERIILCRPAVEAGEKIGFLPGDMKEKIDPYMQPLYDALNETVPSEKLSRLLEKKIIEISPLAFMRGRTLKNAFIILDEAQNATHIQMKMFLTRLGEGSKIAVCGDMSQIDLPRTQQSGLMRAVRLTQGIDGVAHIAFDGSDVIRHPLVRAVVEAYERDEARVAEKAAAREQGAGDA